MQRAAIERLLPAAYQREATDGSVLAAVLDVMETLQAPSMRTLAAVDDLFAPYRTPDHLVTFLARWVALDHLLPSARRESSTVIPVGRVRNLVARGAELAQWRGTAAGLRQLLETATGVVGFDIDEPPDQPFHIVVRVPAAAVDHLPLIRRVVALEKPAACTCDVTVDHTTT
jgi:phage tail-like protein